MRRISTWAYTVAIPQCSPHIAHSLASLGTIYGGGVYHDVLHIGICATYDTDTQTVLGRRSQSNVPRELSPKARLYGGGAKPRNPPCVLEKRHAPVLAIRRIFTQELDVGVGITLLD